MTDKEQLLSEVRRYAALIDATLKPATFGVWPAESATAIQVERGAVFPMALRDPVAFSAPGGPVERLLELSGSSRLEHLAVVDRSAHHRPVYRPLLVYCCLQAFRLAYETLPRSQFGRWEEGLRPWCDLLESQLGQISWPADAFPADHGDSATEAAWSALALHVAGTIYIRDVWTDLASDTFGRLQRSQRDTGAFLHATASDNPETHWYHELVLLHAAASYAVQAEDRPLSAAVARNAAFHLAETQPDHATSQPWATFAFIWNPSTRSLADSVLHASSAQNPAADNTLALMLLADALYCLRLFL